MPLSADDLNTIWVTLKLASLTTLLLLLIATPLAWWLANTVSKWRSLLSAVITLPLVLPPTVLGFYLLITLGPHGPIGQLTNALGLGTLAFTFEGLLIGSIIYSLPFAVQPLQHAFEAVGHRPMEVAATLGAKPLDAFLTVAVPLAKPGFFTAAILTFAHTIGEFGVVLMIGGNIPGQTRVVSTQIYGYVEASQYAHAHWLAGGMILFSLLILLSLFAFNRRNVRVLS